MKAMIITILIGIAISLYIVVVGLMAYVFWHLISKYW